MKYVLIFSLVLLAAACGPAPAPEPPATATPRPTVTPRPTLTPTPTRVRRCPAPNPQAGWIAPATFAGYPDAIRAFLDAGGLPVTLAKILRDASSINDQFGSVQSLDLTGDGERETIVSIFDPPTLDRSPAPNGRLLIYGCAAQHSVLLYDYAAPPYETMPRIVQAGDIVGGPRGAQLATVTSTCGASTCIDRFDVLGWDGQAFVSLMAERLEMPSGKFALVQTDASPALEIVAQGGVIQSVGAGPQRAEKQVWAWNGAQYVLKSVEKAPVEYRIHAVYEGDDAFRAGEFDRAVDWYSRVILDDSLKDWHKEIGYRTQNDRIDLTAYARFRLLLIGVRRGDVNARDQLDALLAENPPGSPAFETANMAQVFWDKYQATRSWADACAAADNYANDQYQIFEDMNLFGYANRAYIPADLCPVNIP